MSTRNPPRPDPADVEHLLAAAVGDPAAHPRLAALLVAAAGPAAPDELADEAGCLAAFRAGHAAAAGPAHRRSGLRTAVRRLTVKAPIAVLAATLTAGTAVAAGSVGLAGSVPGSHPAVAPQAGVPTTASGLARGRPAVPSTTVADPAAGTPAVPPPSLAGLCRAYRQGNKATHGKALDSPAFAALVAAAGGREKVDAYCADRVATPVPDDDPGGSVDEPGQDHPTGPPVDRPGNGNGNGPGNGNGNGPDNGNGNGPDNGNGNGKGNGNRPVAEPGPPGRS